MEAVHNTDAKAGTIEGYEERMEATRFLLFANMLIYCYQQEKDTFLPYYSLTKQKLTGFADEVEYWIEDCLARKKGVSTKTLGFFSNEGKKAEVQDTLDSILKTTYPYMSEARGWTSSRKVIRESEDSVTILTIEVFPKYLPHGYEDKSELILGVKIGRAHV